MGKAAVEIRKCLIEWMYGHQQEERGDWIYDLERGQRYLTTMNKHGMLVLKPMDGKGRTRRFRILVEEVKPVEERIGESLFVAVAFGKDGFTGDSSFACDYAVPAVSNSTFIELLIAWTKTQDEDGELFNCFGDDRPVGFWILPTKAFNIVRSTVRECHNDGAAYVQNSAGKHLVQHLAYRVAGDSSVLK